MTLADLYVDGVLRPGTLLYVVDERTVYEPHRATLEEIATTLSGGDQRRRLSSELHGLWSWVREGLGDKQWRLWVRGDFASTLRPEPAGVDLVLLAADVPESGFAWSLRILSSRPYQIDPAYELDLTLRRGPDFGDFEHDRERVRSSRRCRDNDGEQLVTGWLELVGGGDA